MKKLLTLVVCSLLAICTVSAKDIASGTFKNGGTWKISDQGELYIDAVTVPDYKAKVDYSPSQIYVTEETVRDIYGNTTTNYSYNTTFEITSCTSPWHAYFSYITSVRFSSSVTYIGKYAFAGMWLIKKVTFDNRTSTVTIGEMAFANINNLKTFDFTHVSSIGERAFLGCPNLESNSFPAITYTGYEAFHLCYKLYNKGLVQLGNNVSVNADVIKGFECIAEGCKKGVKLKHTTSNNGIYYTDVVKANSSFRIIVPVSKYSSFKSQFGNIPFSAYTNCRWLKGDDTWYLNEYGVLTVCKATGDFASPSDAPWYSLRNEIKQVYYEGTRTVGKNSFKGYTNLTSINSMLHTVGVSAFEGCTNLKTADLSEVTSIGANAFANTQLGSVSLNAATLISSNAFDGAPLVYLSLGADLTTIGSQAFRNTTLHKIVVMGEAPTTPSNTFENVTAANVTLVVPANIANTYEVAPWNSFTFDRTIAQFPVADSSLDPMWRLFDDGTLMIYKNVPNYTSPQNQPWYNYREFIRKIKIASGVTSIGNYAFAFPTGGISKVTVIESYFDNEHTPIKTLGAHAFENNDQLSEVSLKGVETIGDQAFNGCTRLKNYTFGSNLQSIGSMAFNGCPVEATMSLSTPTPPTVSSTTFQGMGVTAASAPGRNGVKAASSGQKSVKLDVSDAHISKYLAAQYWNLFSFEYIGEHGGIVESDQAYDGLYVLYTDGTMIVSASAPTDPQNINSGFTISSSAKTKVKRIEIQGTLEKLGHQFNDCPNLEEVVLSGGINSLNGTFNNCPKLKTINLENVQYLKSHQQGNKVIPCFGGCTALQEVNIPGVLEIGDNCFKGCTGLTKVALGGEAEVGMEAFSGCTSLKRIALGNAKLNGALQAFQGCTALEEMTYNGTRMPAEIFKGCTALHKINLGGSLKDILSEAFANTAIDSIYVQCPTPPEAAANAFSGITLSSIKVIVPDAFDGPYSSAPVWEEMFTYEDEDYAELDFPIHFAIGNNGFGTVDESGNLTINAMGALVDNFRDYVEPYAPYIIGEIRIGNEVSSLPAGTPYRLPFGWVKEDGPRAIILGSGLLELGDYALYNNVWDCDLIVDCYALNPPVMKGANVFNWSKIQNGSQCVATLNVVNDAAVEAAYRADTYWKKFSISSWLSPADAPAECTVTFVDWDGTILQQTTTRPGMMVTPPADPVRDGYTFKGWDSQEYNWVVSDLTITATYYDETYTVRFYDWDGTLLSEQQVHYGQAAEAPADPAREGYTFLGWSEDFSDVTIDKYIVAMYHNAHEGIEDIQPDQVPNIKVMIDGVIYILRDGKIYNILGTEVK